MGSTRGKLTVLLIFCGVAFCFGATWIAVLLNDARRSGDSAVRVLELLSHSSAVERSAAELRAVATQSPRGDTAGVADRLIANLNRLAAEIDSESRDAESETRADTRTLIDGMLADARRVRGGETAGREGTGGEAIADTLDNLVSQSEWLAVRVRTEPQRRMERMVDQRRRTVWLLLGLVWVAAMFVAIAGGILMKEIFGPAAEIHEAVLQLGAGYRGFRLEPDQPASEFGEVMRDFNDLAGMMERESARARLGMRRREEFLAVGRVAPGVAHEINNPLATIAACAEGMLRRRERNPDAPNDPRDADYLRTIMAEVFRCKELTTRLLELSRRGPSQHESVDPRVLTEEALELAAHAIRKGGVELTTDLAEGLPRIHVDARRIRETLLNLILNSVRALAEESGSSSDTIPAGSGPARKVIRVGLSGSPSVGVNIAVSDNRRNLPGTEAGGGDAPEDDLGLTLAAAVLQSHGGTISAGSEKKAETSGGSAAPTVTWSVSLPAGEAMTLPPAQERDESGGAARGDARAESR